MTSSLEIEARDAVLPLAALSAAECERILAKLRNGIPPSGHVELFTVGRQEELGQLQRKLLRDDAGGGLLLHANYGSGKTHLLRLTQDLALRAGFCVAFVEVSAQHGVRFNRMDTVVGAVSRAIQVPGRPEQGIRALFEAVVSAVEEDPDDDHTDDRDDLTSSGRWNYSDVLGSEALYVAVRAYCVAEDDDARDLAVEWFSHPEKYRTQRRQLMDRLVDDLPVNDPRGVSELYRALTPHEDSHRGWWDALRGLDQLARLAGHRGLVLLFDEFEDVLHGFNNRNLEAQALRNMCEFFAGGYVGGSFWSVTPDFVVKCQDHLFGKGVYDFPFKRLSRLPHFELSPIEFQDFLVLATRIVKTHAQAYAWDAESEVDLARVARFLLQAWRPNEPQRVRLACRELVELLDEELERVEG